MAMNTNLISFLLKVPQSPLFSAWLYASLALGTGCHLYYHSLKESMNTIPSLSTIALGAWGAVNMGFGITLAILLVTHTGRKKMNTRDDYDENDKKIQAIGWGHLPVLFYLLQNYNGGQFQRAGFDTAHLFWLILATTLGVSNILKGWWEPILTIRSLDLMLGAISAFFYVNPLAAAKLILGQDLSQSLREQALVGAEHQYLMLHTVFNLKLVASPSSTVANIRKALGSTALLHVCTLMETVFVRQWHVLLFGVDCFSFPFIGIMMFLVSLGCWTISRCLKI